MHVYEKWLVASAQRDCHLRTSPDSARTVRGKHQAEDGKKEKDGKKCSTWLSVDRWTPMRLKMHKMLHAHQNVYTSVRSENTFQGPHRTDWLSASPDHRTLLRVQISVTHPHSSLLIYSNLPQSGSTGGAKMTPWPVWACVEWGPLILLGDKPTLHALLLLMGACCQTAVISLETGRKSAEKKDKFSILSFTTRQKAAVVISPKWPQPSSPTGLYCFSPLEVDILIKLSSPQPAAEAKVWIISSQEHVHHR